VTLARPAIVLLLAVAGLAACSSGPPAVDAACNTDAMSVQDVVYAYKNQSGLYPSRLADLTQSGPQGPWLRAAPRTDRYSITITPSGNVIVRSLTGHGGGDCTSVFDAACKL
jgi:hypothetical protein